MSAYYNENDKKAAAWLRELIRRNLIAPGEVDERSIEDVRPIDLRGFTQCHFFAGIGGWSYALRLAGWPDDKRVWTGSCPCQPFSAAGKGEGFADKRHLWPAWLHLVSQCGPPTLFGEQVASPDALLWWDLVSADLEGQGYACASDDLCAAGIGAPHIRQRLFWLADAEYGRREARQSQRRRAGTTLPSGTAGRLVDTHAHTCGRHAGAVQRAEAAAPHVLGCPDGLGAADAMAARGLGLSGSEAGGCAPGLAVAGSGDAPTAGGSAESGRSGGDLRPDALAGFWSGADWLGCRDGKWRPVEPGTFPLAHGVPARVVRLRGYGNAIVPQLAAEFVKAAIECGVGQD